MVRKKIETTSLIVLVLSAIVISGCNGSAQSGSETAKNDNTNKAVTNTVAANNNNTSANPANAQMAMVNNNTAVVANNAKKPAPAVKEPTPQIGSGGDDMALFMQVRGALSSDKELANGVIIEIKEGNVTLNGKVSNEAQKAKAAQLAQSIQGVKSVKNNLRVS